MDSPKPEPVEESLESTPQASASAPVTPDVGSGSPTSEPSDNGVVPAPGTVPTGLASGSPNTKTSKRDLLRSLLAHVNIYLVLFIVVVGAGIVIAVVAYNKSNHSQPPTNNSTQNLSAQALQQLANSGTTIGDAQQTLNIQSNSVFQGTVLVRGNLQVAGTVKMGGSLALTGLSVNGSSSFGQLQAKGVSIAGNESVQGQFSAAALSIAGGGNFSGAVTTPSIATNSLQLNGNLELTHHINTGGGVPGSARGNALGGGGTSSVSGSDTAGSISIHTGSSPSAGCFATINFSSAFGGTPHVVVTPIGLGAAGIQYYVNRSSTNFSVCTANPAPSSTSFGFDYIVIG